MKKLYLYVILMCLFLLFAFCQRVLAFFGSPASAFRVMIYTFFKKKNSGDHVVVVVFFFFLVGGCFVWVFFECFCSLNVLWCALMFSYVFLYCICFCLLFGSCERTMSPCTRGRGKKKTRSHVACADETKKKHKAADIHQKNDENVTPTYAQLRSG